MLRLASLGARGRRPVVLAYHAVAEPGAPPPYVSPSLAIPRDLFRRQLERLAGRYRVLSLDEIQRLLTEGGEWPRRSVAITFDDGYADNVELALPELRAVGVPACLYVTTGPMRGGDPLWTAELALLLDRSRRSEVESAGERLSLAGPEERWSTRRHLTRTWAMLDPSELSRRIRALAEALEVDYGQARGVVLSEGEARRWREEGMALGAHTVHHPNLAYQDPEVRRSELEGSMRDLQEVLGERVASMAYPNCGALPHHHGKDTHAAVRKAGFRLAFTSDTGALGPGQAPFSIPRLGVTRRLWRTEILETEIERTRLRGASDA